MNSNINLYFASTPHKTQSVRDQCVSLQYAGLLTPYKSSEQGFWFTGTNWNVAVQYDILRLHTCTFKLWLS